jgi:small subunit ribosomal protein S9
VSGDTPEPEETTPETPSEAPEAAETAEAAQASEGIEATANADRPGEDTVDAETPRSQADDASSNATAAAEESDAEDDDEDDEPVAPREKPAIPGMDLEVDIVTEGRDAGSQYGAYGDEDDLSDAADEQVSSDEDDLADEPIAQVEINLTAGARYTATGKRKTAIARVILVPGTGAYTINGKELNEFFPRATLQRNIRQPLEVVGYEERMDVIARMEGGGVAAQADALRHGISRALLEADPNLRGELKRRGFLTRDARAKERKKAGLKKARKRPQFSKR